MPGLRERIIGCLLGGAVGDALGGSIEFISLPEIRHKFGPGGLRDYSPAYGRLGAITDDTQMTLFTVEGLIQAYDRGRDRGIHHPPTMVYHAYLRWLITQGEGSAQALSALDRGGLLSIRALHARRAPGNTCLSALASGQMGTVEQPINTSKGCGGVMRAAPAGLLPMGDPFKLGCDVAAITHGHPSGYLTAGFLAQVIADILAGETLDAAVAYARHVLMARPGHEECLQAVDQATRFARDVAPTPEQVERLGQGWVAEEALAISLYCALTAKSLEQGVLRAVNHGGDSDSTGAITGNILGACWGRDAIPSRWLGPLELRQEIEDLAIELARRAAV